MQHEKFRKYVETISWKTIETTLLNIHFYDIRDFANKAINEQHASPSGHLQNKITEDIEIDRLLKQVIRQLKLCINMITSNILFKNLTLFMLNLAFNYNSILSETPIQIKSKVSFRKYAFHIHYKFCLQ